MADKLKDIKIVCTFSSFEDLLKIKSWAETRDNDSTKTAIDIAINSLFNVDIRVI